MSNTVTIKEVLNKDEITMLSKMLKLSAKSGRSKAEQALKLVKRNKPMGQNDLMELIRIAKLTKDAADQDSSLKSICSSMLKKLMDSYNSLSPSLDEFFSQF